MTEREQAVRRLSQGHENSFDFLYSLLQQGKFPEFFDKVLTEYSQYGQIDEQHRPAIIEWTAHNFHSINNVVQTYINTVDRNEGTANVMGFSLQSIINRAPPEVKIFASFISGVCVHYHFN